MVFRSPNTNQKRSAERIELSQQSRPELRNSVLILWDLQYGIAPRATNYSDLLHNARHLLEAFHTSTKPVIYSQHTGVPYEYMTKYQIGSMQKRGLDPKTARFMAENSHDWQIIEEVKPSEQDMVVRKHTASFFVGTMLDTFLKARGVETIVLSGVSTDAGIEGTARHAAYLGYSPIIVEDAVGSSSAEMHEAALKVMRRMFEIKKTQDIIDAL